MRRVVRISTTAAAALAVVAVAPWPGMGAAPGQRGDGSLARLSGEGSCASPPGGSRALRALRAGCVRSRALAGLRRAALSPGGGSLYATGSDLNAVAVFSRSRTGALRPLAGSAACVSNGARNLCGGARGLRNPYDVVVSPDGRNVYAGSWPGAAIVAFARNRRTGALRQLSGRAGCVGGRRGDGCRRAVGLGSGVISLAFSPSGRFLYAGTTAGLVAFRRDARTGRLAQLGGLHGGVGGTSDVALDPRGENLYAAAGSLFAFRLDGGAPRRLPGAAGCINDDGGGGCTDARSLNGPASLAVSRNGAQVYVAVEFSAAVAILTRDGRTGALTQRPGELGCIRDGGALDCAPARHLEHPAGLALSHDGRNAYSVGRGVAIVMRRNRSSGRLSQLPGKRGCLDSLSRAGARRADCTDSGRVNPLGLTLSGDGRNAYVLDTETDVIAAYRRR